MIHNVIYTEWALACLFLICISLFAGHHWLAWLVLPLIPVPLYFYNIYDYQGEVLVVALGLALASVLGLWRTCTESGGYIRKGVPKAAISALLLGLLVVYLSGHVSIPTDKWGVTLEITRFSTVMALLLLICKRTSAWWWILASAVGHWFLIPWNSYFLGMTAMAITLVIFIQGDSRWIAEANHISALENLHKSIKNRSEPDK